MRKWICRIFNVAIVLVFGGLLYVTAVANVFYYNITTRRKTR